MFKIQMQVYPFLDNHVHDPNFDVSSDAQDTVRAMLAGGAPSPAAATAAGGPDDAAAAEERRRRREGIAADFLRRRYVDVVDARISRKCLAADNYMTRRLSLQLLASLLLDRANYGVMMTYVAAAPNLVTILCLLRDPSPHITLDAFQVFKIFVANPAKVRRPAPCAAGDVRRARPVSSSSAGSPGTPASHRSSSLSCKRTQPPEVTKILFDNKVKLVKYLEGLHKDRENSDEQYRDEKRLVISTLEELEI